MTHKIGSKVRVHCPGSVNHGSECTVIGPLRRWKCRGLAGETYWGQEVDIPHPTDQWFAYEPHELVPIYDGNEPVAWEDCVWQPNSVTA